jgi:hypothetical protein
MDATLFIGLMIAGAGAIATFFILRTEKRLELEEKKTSA